MPKYDYDKLRVRIYEVCGTQEEFANRLGITTRSLINKLNGDTPFKQHEMERACEVLKLKVRSIPTYFYTKEVR